MRSRYINPIVHIPTSYSFSYFYTHMLAIQIYAFMQVKAKRVEETFRTGQWAIFSLSEVKGGLVYVIHF
jgi:hypothetical protein